MPDNGTTIQNNLLTKTKMQLTKTAMRSRTIISFRSIFSLILAKFKVSKKEKLNLQ